VRKAAGDEFVAEKDRTLTREAEEWNFQALRTSGTLKNKLRKSLFMKIQVLGSMGGNVVS